MDLSTYKLIHYAGMITLFFAFGGLTLGARLTNGRGFAHRLLYILLHGIGLVLLIISGFAQFAKLQIAGGMPVWLIAKLIIWLLLGVILSFVLRKPKANSYSWIILLGLGVTAAYLGLMKPF